jgi:hypothetical protein
MTRIALLLTTFLFSLAASPAALDALTQQDPQADPKAAGSSAEKPADQPAKEEPKDKEPSAKTAPGEDAQGANPYYQTAEEVLDQMRNQQPTTEIVRPNRAGEIDPEGGTRLLPEGTPIINRAGRLIREGEWWLFAFESDHPEHPEPPMKLLPNSNLGAMVRMGSAETTGLVFIVSGECTVFQGENYLMLRSVKRRLNLGNLHP